MFTNAKIKIVLFQGLFASTGIAGVQSQEKNAKAVLERLDLLLRMVPRRQTTRGFRVASERVDTLFDLRRRYEENVVQRLARENTENEGTAMECIRRVAEEAESIQCAAKHELSLLRTTCTGGETWNEIDQLYEKIAELYSERSKNPNDPNVHNRICGSLNRLRQLQKEEARTIETHLSNTLFLPIGKGEELLQQAEELMPNHASTSRADGTTQGSDD